MSKCRWKNNVDRLTPHRVATNLQFVKTAVSLQSSEKQNTVKHSAPVRGQSEGKHATSKKRGEFKQVFRVPIRLSRFFNDYRECW